MSSNTASRPLFVIAAIAVILFSVTGTATLLGWLPSAHSGAGPVADTNPLKPASGPGTPPMALAGAGSPASDTRPTTPVPPASPAPAALVPPPGSAPTAAESTAKDGAPPMTNPPHPVCRDCGVVRAVERQRLEGQASGLGAVAGGLLGAVVGHQIGNGNGNTAATLLGAGGGALAGNTIEKNTHASERWNVRVELAAGGTRTFHFREQPDFAVGSHVRIQDGRLIPAS